MFYKISVENDNGVLYETNIVSSYIDVTNWNSVLNINSIGNNPVLSWAPFSESIDGASAYKIYRGLPNPIKPTIFNYSLIATVGNDVF